MGLIATPALGRRRFVVGGLAAAGTLILPAGLAAAGRARRDAADHRGAVLSGEVPARRRQRPRRAARQRGAGRGHRHPCDGPGARARRPADAGRDRRDLAMRRARALHHPGDTGGRPRDKAFQGYGRAVSARTAATASAPSGPCPIRAARRTSISPSRRRSGASSSPRCMSRASRGTTRDGLYRAIRDPRQRAAVTVRLEPANGIEPGALAGAFDLVLA